MFRIHDASSSEALYAISLLDRAIFASISAMSVFALFSPLF